MYKSASKHLKRKTIEPITSKNPPKIKKLTKKQKRIKRQNKRERSIGLDDDADCIMRMAFGKHKGKRLDKIPLDYLEWLAKNNILYESRLKDQIDEILGTKFQEDQENIRKLKDI